jgi:hypothetical protein
MAGHFDKIRRWGEINLVLEKAWDPVKDLVAERDEIEKSVPWLKGKGATPFPPKPPLPPSSAALPKSPPREETILLDHRPPKKSKGKSQKAVEKKMSELKAQGGTGNSPSDTPISGDHSQSFQGKNF